MINRNKRGLTFIEIMGILLIIGIISSIAYATFNLTYDKSELSMGHNQASAIQDVVAGYMADNGGELPLAIKNADFLLSPALVDLSKVSNKFEGKPKGNFYIYGPSKDVFFDYPVEYIEKIYNSYNNKSEIIIANESRIDTDKLYSKGLLEYKPFTNYVLMGDGSVIQTLDRDKVNETSNGKPTNPIIIPNKLAPYYTDDDISFTATSYSPKGEVTFEWKNAIEGQSKKYPVGVHKIEVVAIDKDGVKSDISTFDLEINSSTNRNRPPNAPTIVANPFKTTYTSDEVISLSATATDPDGDSVSYVWMGKSNNNIYPRGTHEVSVYAIDSKGATSPISRITLKVSNGSPIISGVSYNPNPAYQFDNVYFKVNAKDLDGDLIHYEWQFDVNENGVIESNEKNLPSIDGKYKIGTYSAAVRVVDSMGSASAWKYFNFTISNREPTDPNFSYTPSNGPYRTNTNFNFTANGSIDRDGDSITYLWRVDGGTWNTKEPDGKFSIGNHTVEVKAQDSRGADSNIKKFSFKVINTEPTKPIFKIQSTKNTITNLNPVITTPSTDLDNHTFIYYWRLDGGNWTTTKPTQRLVSGNHTLELKATDELGFDSEIYSETFYVNTTQISYTHQFDETTSQNRSGYYTVPYGSRFTIDSYTVNTGNVNVSKSNSNINISVSNGDWSSREAWWNDYLYSKSATASRTNSVNSFATSYPYSDSYGYSGNIGKSGSSRVISGLPPHSYTETEYRTSSSNSFPNTISFNSNGYSGTLSKSGGSYVKSGSYTAGATTSATGYVSTAYCPSKSGYSTTSCTYYGVHVASSGDTYSEIAKAYYGNWVNTWTTLEDVNNQEERRIQINSKIILPMSIKGYSLKTSGVKNGYYYKATYQKPATDTRIYEQKYVGTVYRPDSRTWQQDYAGTVYKGGTDYKNYKWKYTVTIKYTVY